MNWPDFFPADCPPPESYPPSGQVYRLTDKKDPREKDFKSYKELAKEKPDPQISECQWCGLSVYTDKNDIIRIQNRIPGKRKKFIAIGSLNPNLGKILPTPGYNTQSHHTWWVPVGISPVPFFAAALEK